MKNKLNQILNVPLT